MTLELTTTGDAPVTLFGTDDPTAIVARSTAMANALAGVIRDKKLTSAINGRDYVRVEGWTLLGSMVGVFPVCVWTRPVADGWEARVEARTISGGVVGAAESECLRSEDNWADRDDFALRSMAQTRATAKALRLPLGFIVVMAGYEATPAEEMSGAGPAHSSGYGRQRLAPPVSDRNAPSCPYHGPAKVRKNKGGYWYCATKATGEQANTQGWCNWDGQQVVDIGSDDNPLASSGNRTTQNLSQGGSSLAERLDGRDNDRPAAERESPGAFMARACDDFNKTPKQIRDALGIQNGAELANMDLADLWLTLEREFGADNAPFA